MQGSIPGLGRSPGEGQGNPLQYSCLENPMENGAWRATVHRVTKSQTRLKGPSTHTYVCIVYICTYCIQGFPHSSGGKESACNAGDSSSIPGSGKICWRRDRLPTPVFLGFPCGSAGKESACNLGDLGSIPGLGRSPGEGKGYPLQRAFQKHSGVDSNVFEVKNHSPFGTIEPSIT